MSTFDYKISVIIPVYNSSKYLSRCLDSILNQTYTNLEIICVNDGSTDSSGAILDKYARNNENITVVHKENGGSASARAIAVEHITGDYVTFVDSDDWIDTSEYQEMASIISKFHPDIIASGFIRDYGTHSIIEVENPPHGYFEGDLYNNIKKHLVNDKCYFSFGISASLCNKAFRKDIIVKYLKNVDIRIKTDTDTICSYPALWSANSIFVSDKCWYHYCQNDASVLHSSNKDRTESITLAYRYLRDINSRFFENNASYEKQISYLEQYSWIQLQPEHLLFYENNHLFGYGTINPNDMIILYGAGVFGRRLYNYIIQNTNIQLVAWVDKNGDGQRIVTPDVINQLSFDMILIAAVQYTVTQDIIDMLTKMNIPSNKIRSLNFRNETDSTLAKQI